MLKGKCNQCGQCCLTFRISLDYKDLQLFKPEGDFKFARENLIPMHRELAFFLNPHLKIFEEKESSGTNFYYKCKQFNTKTRKCNNHKNRPQVCKGFPWYGKKDYNNLVYENLYDENCGYKIDREIFKIILILGKIIVKKDPEFYKKSNLSLGELSVKKNV